ncbi:NmrA family NAD(P)-binding protein [Amycolatopsis cynarae]|uniref:NmrA family NAD(P)-binding protein n=1 Tax=Amycolatopsis cynarae TaxID=2995223 RepID=A0ABY7BBL6_9PSEU|nr:NmrA family NAD(P)-binding protein [Amycolatopsis sp. HUAS 11-8]WAL69078.1 NmrA family NAD(P)-binding protein [Amycolatopsis sp. HUAS 11-8]
MGKILVTGATGKVGGNLVSLLADAGYPVRAVVRDPARAALPAAVEVVRGDLSDPDSVARAVHGVDAVFLIWPGIAVEPRTVKAIITGVRQVVYLSTDVADLADGEPATSFHQEIERLIRDSGVRWTFLRPIDFAANMLAWSGQVRQGVVRWPYARAARSLIHERDIAEAAATVLTIGGHDGARYVLTGPEALTHAELAGIIGEVIGRPVRWEEQDPGQAYAELAAAWGNPGFAAARLAAWKSFVETPERVTDTVPRLLGRPARTFRSWVQDHLGDFS